MRHRVKRWQLLDFLDIADGYRLHGFDTCAIGLLRLQHPGTKVSARPPESERRRLAIPGLGPRVPCAGRELSPTVPEVLT
ncbi:hypothetical protein D9M72_225640 [compost metagenome]